ncbi:gliding motility-associated protein GldM [Mucilaginibacter yixingensis]|uniref:Gliding motility-associated protein GldM n=1 Tax=Mucilaginibacter yixingensis TaxID=1295612 RepID=A0A2T5J7F2_9SPHI|nr:gliding motility protein GldM [Mucilaginibacter yixingensis]PTQ95073.1 gliding motility-associated protein GldM [Mucilaginibacter yixingensis]
MAGGKETTRQKMINIMYLVLIAMLALNVSDSVLNAFRNLKESMNTAKNNSQASIDQLFSTFEATKMKESPERARPLLDTANAAKKYSDDLNSYVEDLKSQMVKEGEGMDPETNDVTKRSDMDIAPRMMINEGKGKALKAKIQETRAKLIGLLNKKDQASVTFTLDAQDGKKGTWEQSNFGDGTPLTAALTVLTKIQADTKNAETEIVKRVFGKMDQALVTLDKFSAVAVAPSSYVLSGQPYTAEVFLTASDSKSSPTITVNGSTLPITEGKGKYSVTTGAEGVHTWTASITVKQTDGTSKTYTTPTQTYTVARPSAVVSADKMNVLYIGVENPLSISAPGVAKGVLHVSMSNGSLSGSDGKYIAKVSSIGETNVTVTGEKGQVLGTTKFRTKRIPDPKAFFAGKSGGNTSAANIRAQDRLFARLDGFDFDAKFSVTHYTLLVVKPRQDAIIKPGSGNVLTGDMKTALSSVTPGSTVVFRDITAVGPDGVQREIDPIVLSATN